MERMARSIRGILGCRRCAHRCSAALHVLINSACHTIGRQPYSTKCSAGDSFFLALLTLGEGYHNYHHEFQYDYRNGVKPWQMDPTKWVIWMLSKLRLVRGLRRASADKIRSAQRDIGERAASALAECSPVP